MAGCWTNCWRRSSKALAWSVRAIAVTICTHSGNNSNRINGARLESGMTLTNTSVKEASLPLLRRLRQIAGQSIDQTGVGVGFAQTQAGEPVRVPVIVGADAAEFFRGHSRFGDLVDRDFRVRRLASLQFRDGHEHGVLAADALNVFVEPRKEALLQETQPGVEAAGHAIAVAATGLVVKFLRRLGKYGCTLLGFHARVLPTNGFEGFNGKRPTSPRILSPRRKNRQPVDETTVGWVAGSASLFSGDRQTDHAAGGLLVGIVIFVDPGRRNGDLDRHRRPQAVMQHQRLDRRQLP